MAALDVVLEQAMQLSDEERGTLAVRLMQSLEPEDGEDVSGAAWEAAWSAEIDRRVAEVDQGAELLDGDEVMADARTWLAEQRAR
jgi:putative addiction module component (TIGR02574 family)